MCPSESPSDDVSDAVDAGTGERSVASGESPNPASGIVGRDEELARIHGLLARASTGRSSALLVEGAPGIGKTTLLHAARSAASGFTILSATGVPPESVLAHAGLLELLHPLRRLLPEIPEAQGTALGSALGWAAGEVPADRFLVAAATLSLLATSAEERPVLVVVDDLQWLDRQSAEAILFAARRLGPDAVAFVFASRASAGPDDLAQGIPALRVAGLPAAAVVRLLPRDLAPHVVDRLVAGTQGNPLALLEASSRLTDAQRVGAAPLPDPLPVGEHLQSVYGSLLTGLSADAWRAALFLAVAPGSSAAATTALAHVGGDPESAFDEARQHGVLAPGDPDLTFRHPLVRGAVLQLATPAQQRSAHRAVADALPADSPARTWHLAQATAGVDDQLADELARLAETDRIRWGFAAAAAALERAAALTGRPELSADRLAAAAEDAFLAGDVTRTRALVARVLEAPAPDDVRGRALFALGMLEQYAGSVPQAADHLTDAAELLSGVTLVRALTELAMARFRLNELGEIAECAARIDAAADLDDPEQRLLACYTGGVALILRGEPGRGFARLAEVRPLALSDDLRHDPRALLLMALAAGFTGTVAEAMAAGDARIDDIRRRGALGTLVPTLAIRASGRAMLGDHVGAFADAGEAAELAEQIGYAADAAVAVEMLAWQSAARGLHDEATEALARARALTDRAGTTSVAAHQALTEAFCALCRGDLAAVATTLEARLVADGGIGALGEPLGVAPLLVEAYVGLGRVADARELTARYAGSESSSAPARVAALVARCQCLTANDEKGARHAFDRSETALTAAGDAFEAARTRLLYGARLRREGHRVAAREQLRAAREVFIDLDLTQWARTAADELAATGATARRRNAEVDEPLTSQETRVALLVARGMSNREVAAALFLSPKTVEHHLGSVFRKRGFKSRTQLAHAYARLADPGPDD